MCVERWGIWGETKFCLCKKKRENVGWCVWRDRCGVCVCVDWNVCEHIYKGMWGLCMDILGCVWETRDVWRDRWGREHVEKLMCMYLCV